MGNGWKTRGFPKGWGGGYCFSGKKEKGGVQGKRGVGGGTGANGGTVGEVGKNSQFVKKGALFFWGETGDDSIGKKSRSRNKRGMGGWERPGPWGWVCGK